jgi:hypothetical protein
VIVRHRCPFVPRPVRDRKRVCNIATIGNKSHREVHPRSRMCDARSSCSVRQRSLWSGGIHR